jgi:hypothetical protein
MRAVSHIAIGVRDMEKSGRDPKTLSIGGHYEPTGNLD